MVYLVMFNLRQRRYDYTMFFAALQLKDWFNFFDNAWLISTNESTEELANRLNNYIANDDWLLIMRVTADYFGWLPDEARDWLTKEYDEGRLRP